MTPYNSTLLALGNTIRQPRSKAYRVHEYRPRPMPTDTAHKPLEPLTLHTVRLEADRLSEWLWVALVLPIMLALFVPLAWVASVAGLGVWGR